MEKRFSNSGFILAAVVVLAVAVFAVNYRYQSPAGDLAPTGNLVYRAESTGGDYIGLCGCGQCVGAKPGDACFHPGGTQGVCKVPAINSECSDGVPSKGVKCQCVVSKTGNV